MTKRINATRFRLLFLELREPFEVTKGGDVVGQWTPIGRPTLRPPADEVVSPLRRKTPEETR